MRCEDNSNFYLSFDKFRKNNLPQWYSLIVFRLSRYSLTFSSLNLPLNRHPLQAENYCHNPKLPNIVKAIQPPASLQLAVRQPASCQPAASKLARTTLAIYISVWLNLAHIV